MTGPLLPTRRPGVTLLTVAEIAVVLRVGKMTIYRLIHSGALPSYRVGRSFRVPEKALDDYLHQRGAA